MSENVSSAAVVIGSLRVNPLHAELLCSAIVVDFFHNELFK